jgi:hypothetical protein
VQNFLVLDMDVVMFGGVTASHLRAQIEIWDRLIQELVPFLRDRARGAAVRDDAAGQVAAGAVAVAVG